MFSYISGCVVYKDPSRAVIEVQGVGYELCISSSTYEALVLEQKGKLFVHMQVKEELPVLYGFISPQEKECFLALTSVRGIGAKVGMAVLSACPIAELTRALAAKDIPRLKSIKGVGEKAAQRLVVELHSWAQDKADPSTPVVHASSDLQEQAVLALMRLGFAKSASQRAVQQVLQQQTSPIAVEELVRLALLQA